MTTKQSKFKQKMGCTSQELDRDPQQAGVFHQSIWNIEHWVRSYATEALGPAHFHDRATTSFPLSTITQGFGNQFTIWSIGLTQRF